MKKFILSTILLVCFIAGFGQRKKADSVISIYNTLPDNEQRLKVLKQIVNASRDSGAVVVKYSKKGVALAKKLDKPKDEMAFLTALQLGYLEISNYPKQLETCFEGLELNATLHNDSVRVVLLNFITLGYGAGKDYQKSINYGLAGLKIARQLKYKVMVSALLNNISRQYKALGKLDSALFYMQSTYQYMLENKKPEETGFPLVGMGEIEAAMHRDTMALGYYRRAVPPFTQTKNYANLSYAYIMMGEAFSKIARRDSALLYAQWGYKMGSRIRNSEDMMKGAALLSTLYEGFDDKQSLQYYKIATAARDSLNNIENIKQLQVLNIREQEKQAELAERKLAEEEEAKENLQLMTIAFFIPVFILLVLVLSRTRIHRRLIDFLGVLSVLLLFEFITLLLDPWIEKITHHKPLLELFILVGLAAVLVPLHHSATHWLKQKLSRPHHPNPEHHD